MSRKLCLVYLIALFAVIVVAFADNISFASEEKGKLFAYVACEDRRIYVIDMDKNDLIFKTDEVREMGRPTAIDIDQIRGQLYVASERGYWQENYFPIISLNINSCPIKIIKEFPLIIDKPTGKFEGVSAVYEIVVSPDGNNLYILYAHPKYYGVSAIVDRNTGNLIGSIDFIIRKSSIFSPDGKEVAEIWPGGSKAVEKNGKQILREWSGGVAVFNIKQNKLISQKEIIKDKVKLTPPWYEIPYPLYVVNNHRNLRSINRNTGKTISEVDLEKITEGLNTSIKSPLIFDRGKKTVIPMSDKTGQGYTVLIDLEKMEMIRKIDVGKSPTNIVLSTIEPKCQK
jgi:hypothetical protein